MIVPTAQVFQAGVDLLTSCRSTYVLIGGIAAGIWGDPRETKDADFVVALHPNEIGPLLRRATEMGFKIDEQVIHMNLQISGVARLPFGGRYVDFLTGDSDFDRSALQRGKSMRVLDREVLVASAEDLVLYKLVAMRDQDVADVRKVLIRQARALDAAYLRRWAAVLSEKLEKPEIAAKLQELLREYGLPPAGIV